MGKVFALVFAVAGVSAMACGPSEHVPPQARSSSALYGGTAIPDASQVGVVHLEWLENQTDATGCNAGTGVMLTATTVLTAGHVADYDYAKYRCSPTVPKVLRIKMPAPADAGGDTLAWINCGSSTCGEKLHPKYRGTCGDAVCGTNESATSCALDCTGTCGNHAREEPQDYEAGASNSKRYVMCPKDCPSSGDNDDGSDVAVIETATKFVVGGDLFHTRPITRKPTSTFYGTKVTCYGMGRAAPTTFLDGVLRTAEFTVLPFPHALSDGSSSMSALSWPHMFAVSRGGGVSPGPFQDDGGAYVSMVVGGDSGGPCIAHTTGYSAASGFRDFVDCRPS
ncbi:MAG: hypothetical protein U0263_02065 [Polyangiaceae bacterium]